MIEMTQEYKELLFKEICGRLPYMVKARVYSYWNEKYIDDYIMGVNTDIMGFLCSTNTRSNIKIELIKPYILPMSSMTDEQKEDLLLTVVGEEGLNLFNVTKDGIISSFSFFNNKEEQSSIESFRFNNVNFSNETTEAYIDWLNRNHFDYRGLIEKGLAIDATGLNIY